MYKGFSNKLLPTCSHKQLQEEKVLEKTGKVYFKEDTELLSAGK
jgi:hypothetical protein